MSMSPLHGAVLGAAAVVSSPALWLTLVDGTLTLADALTRYLISVALCWIALNVVAQLVLPRSTPAGGAAVDLADDDTALVAAAEAADL